MQWTYNRRVQSVDFIPGHATPSGKDVDDAVKVELQNGTGKAASLFTIPASGPVPPVGSTVKVTVEVVDPISGEPVE